jgi:hypothetical protein
VDLIPIPIYSRMGKAATRNHDKVAFFCRGSRSVNESARHPQTSFKSTFGPPTTSSANLENLLDDNPSPDDVDFLEQQIYGYNVGHTAIREGRELAIFMRDPRGHSKHHLRKTLRS